MSSLRTSVVRQRNSMVSSPCLLQRLWLIAVLVFPIASAFVYQRECTSRRQQQGPELHAFPGFPSLNGQVSNREKIPFVIDRIQGLTREDTYSEISDMCISVFFNDDVPLSATLPPWKALQLGYLRSVQAADLRQRQKSKSQINDMFVARRVIPISSTTVPSQPLLLDDDIIFNPVDDDNVEYIRGEILGFCEVTERPFGLGHPFDSSKVRGKSHAYELRPVLTNLSVKADARRSGVGTRLVEACENAVLSWRGASRTNEIILEVEDDNPKALRFYEKRGYSVLFADPASRRYDTNGFFLKRVRSTKICMRKTLDLKRALLADEKVKTSISDFGSNLFQKLNVFQKSA